MVPEEDSEKWSFQVVGPDSGIKVCNEINCLDIHRDVLDTSPDGASYVLADESQIYYGSTKDLTESLKEKKDHQSEIFSPFESASFVYFLANGEEVVAASPQTIRLFNFKTKDIVGELKVDELTDLKPLKQTQGFVFVSKDGVFKHTTQLERISDTSSFCIDHDSIITPKGSGITDNESDLLAFKPGAAIIANEDGYIVKIQIDGQWEESEEICPPFGNNEVCANLYAEKLDNWPANRNTLLLTTTQTTDMGLVVDGVKINPSDESARMPLTTGDEDAVCVGSCLDLVSKPIVNAPLKGVDVASNLPLWLILTQEGRLVAWAVANADACLENTQLPVPAPVPCASLNSLQEGDSSGSKVESGEPQEPQESAEEPEEPEEKAENSVEKESQPTSNPFNLNSLTETLGSNDKESTAEPEPEVVDDSSDQNSEQEFGNDDNNDQNTNESVKPPAFSFPKAELPSKWASQGSFMDSVQNKTPMPSLSSTFASAKPNNSPFGNLSGNSFASLATDKESKSEEQEEPEENADSKGTEKPSLFQSTGFGQSATPAASNTFPFGTAGNAFAQKSLFGGSGTNESPFGKFGSPGSSAFGSGFGAFGGTNKPAGENKSPFGNFAIPEVQKFGVSRPKSIFGQQASTGNEPAKPEESETVDSEHVEVAESESEPAELSEDEPVVVEPTLDDSVEHASDLPETPLKESHSDISSDQIKSPSNNSSTSASPEKPHLPHPDALQNYASTIDLKSSPIPESLRHALGSLRSSNPGTPTEHNSRPTSRDFDSSDINTSFLRDEEYVNKSLELPKNSNSDEHLKSTEDSANQSILGSIDDREASKDDDDVEFNGNDNSSDKLLIQELRSALESARREIEDLARANDTRLEKKRIEEAKLAEAERAKEQQAEAENARKAEAEEKKALKDKILNSTEWITRGSSYPGDYLADINKVYEETDLSELSEFDRIYAETNLFAQVLDQNLSFYEHKKSATNSPDDQGMVFEGRHWQISDASKLFEELNREVGQPVTERNGELADLYAKITFLSKKFECLLPVLLKDREHLKMLELSESDAVDHLLRAPIQTEEYMNKLNLKIPELTRKIRESFAESLMLKVRKGFVPKYSHLLLAIDTINNRLEKLEKSIDRQGSMHQLSIESPLNYGAKPRPHSNVQRNLRGMKFYQQKLKSLQHQEYSDYVVEVNL